MKSEPALIVGTLKTVRRRLFLVLLVNSSLVAVCGLAFALALFSIRRVPTGVPPRGVAILLFCLAFFSALLAAFLRMPSWKETAKLVDRRVGLQQRLETAWECLIPREEIDLLLLRDAWQRLRHLRPATVVPMRLARLTKVALGAGLITLSSLAVIRLLGGWDQWGLFQSEQTTQLSGQAQPQAKGKLTARTPETEEARNPGRSPAPGFSATSPNSNPRSRASNTTPASAGNPQTESVAAAREPPSTPGAGKGAAEERPPNDTGSSRANPAKPLPAQSNKPDQQSEETPPRPSQPPAQPSNSGAGAARLLPSSTGAASIRESGRRAGSQAAGTRAAPGAPGNAGSAVSLKQTMQSSAPLGLSKNDAAFLARHAQDYQTFWLATEAALAKDKIPPGFRKYIADYFAAIHP